MTNFHIHNCLLFISFIYYHSNCVILFSVINLIYIRVNDDCCFGSDHFNQ